MTNDSDSLRDRELDRVVSMQEAARLMGISPETIRRRYREKVLQLSERRQGMRLRDALRLDEPNTAA
jgi:DeoR/GlpR family transcriptional regulator of sugar metabolism